MPAVGWDGRDVSGLSHEQIHRWTRDGASPEALAAARDRHLARADELRGAADRLQAAQRGVGETWVGRDADAAGARTRVLAERMSRLAETVGGQARGVDGLRAALVRVRAAVGPPRPPALPGLGVAPVLEELRSLVTGRPADGYGGFRAAAADQAAAREAYRTYLAETAAAARGVGPAGAGGPAVPGTVPGAATAPGRTPLPVGARGAASGVLQRAAGPGEFPTTGAGVRSPVAAGGVGPGGATGAPGPAPGVARPGAGPVAGSAPGGAGAGVAGGSPVGTAGGVPGGSGVGSVGPAGSARRPVGVGPVGVGPGGPATGGAPEPGGAGPARGGTVVGAPVPGGPRPVEPTRRRNGWPAAGDRPPGAPGLPGDDRPGRGADFGPDGPSAATSRPDEGAEPEEDDRAAVPVRHVSWLVDADPAGWGAGGRRVAPPVLGEGP
ncbi:WXG100 family type VII secretion target [Actinomycetospora soli]|uniref:WXG100 family type VII secretion target n=1 Tax=Actinomycetospora soli TaxID=2893887 RepID=UPI001E578659|nr:hypothetical protein [Actinomycetospora soli]MCD2188528.1 hypothetical protein [Actinomycetospora soli]